MDKCNICGGDRFEPGPNGRLAPSGARPRCSNCHSLERHRSLRACLSRLPHSMLSWRRAIQFAPDASLDATWFRSLEGSEFGGANSLDLQDISRPANSYDFISLSSVLEFVPNDRRAFSELLRVGTPDCIIHCTFNPLAEATAHYSEPHGAFGRLHLYGLDLDSWFETRTHGLTTVVATAIDPVTGVPEPIHFFCRRASDARDLSAHLTKGTPVFDVVISAATPAIDPT